MFHLTGKDLAVFVVSYTLAPDAHYPVQLRQAVGALRYMLSQARFQPEHVILGGDSCGGNFIFGVLSHISHKHPEIGALKVSGSLLGAVVIAPWTFIGEDYFAHESSLDNDLATPYVGRVCSDAYLGNERRDYYTNASDAPQGWFEKFAVCRILVLAGENEFMLPYIERFVQKLQVRQSLLSFRPHTSFSYV